MTLEIPDRILEHSNWTAQEFLLELAVGLYAGDKMSSAQAAAVAGLDRIAFSRLFGERGISTGYGGVDDLDREVANLKRLGMIWSLPATPGLC